MAYLTKEEEELYDKEFSVNRKKNNIGNARETINTKSPEDLTYKKSIKIIKIKELIHPKALVKYRYPKFQRDTVWLLPAISALIESILFHRPIGELCLMYATPMHHWVIDGQQRLMALIKFIVSREFEGYKFELELENKLFNRCSFTNLPKNYQNAILEESVAVVVYEPKTKGVPIDENDMTGIFGRLNESGEPLSMGEALNGFFQGDFMGFVDYWAKDPKFLNAVQSTTYRAKSTVMVTRLLALSTIGSRWSGSLNIKNLINSFTELHWYLLTDTNEGKELNEVRNCFEEVTNIIHELPLKKIGALYVKGAGCASRNRVLLDILWYGFTKIIRTGGEKPDKATSLKIAKAVFNHSDYKWISIKDEDHRPSAMTGRFKLANEIFSDYYGNK